LPRRCTIACLTLLLALSACDRTPGDPLDGTHDVAALLDLDGANRQSPHTIEGLLHSAVHRVYTEQGSAAARMLVAELRRLQDAERSARGRMDRDATAQRLQTLRGEQLDVVLRVFGNPIVDRVRAGVHLEAARLRRGVDELEAAGRPLPHARELLVTMSELMAEADRASAAGNAAAALDAAARAASTADAVRAGMADANRIAGLAELFDLSIAHVEAANGSATVDIAHYDALRRAADQAVRTGDRDRAQQALEAVRAEQVRIVLEVLGVDAAVRLVEAVRNSAIATETEVAREMAAGRDLVRIARMAAAARDMGHRAATALSSGDPATALDLASHAAGLVNSARVALAYR